jgi:hypothetical protein
VGGSRTWSNNSCVLVRSVSDPLHLRRWPFVSR